MRARLVLNRQEPHARHRRRRADDTTPHTELLRLQRLAGNRGVTGLMSGATAAPTPLSTVAQRQTRRTSPPSCSAVPTMAPPATLPPFAHNANPSWMTMEPAPGGLANIRAAPGAGPSDMGFTPWKQPEPPDIRFVPYEVRGGRWTTRIEFTPAPSIEVPATFPGPGIHTLAGGERYVISPQMSDTIRRGELEHMQDYLYAQQLVSQTISRIVYRAIGHARPQAASADAAVKCGWDWFRAALPPQLRWDPSRDTGTLRFMWLQYQNGLAGVTMRRDDRWHSVARRALTDAERRRHRIGRSEEAFEIVPGPSEIDRHPTQALLQQRWATMPTFP